MQSNKPAKIDETYDHSIISYVIPGFDNLDIQKKNLLWALYNACHFGRDITWDQNYKHNLAIRQMLERVMRSNNKLPKEFTDYMKMVWICNGIHHCFTGDKIQPHFSRKWFESLQEITEKDKPMIDIIFDPKIAPQRTCKDKTVGDLVKCSSVNFYGPGISESDVKAFYKAKKNTNDPEPPSYGLNSTLVKRTDGSLEEDVWKVGGKYGKALEKCVEWLRRALPWAENLEQRIAFEALIKYYESGNLRDFDVYSKLWLKDTKSEVDMIHGFIEVYKDPLCYRGHWEAILTLKTSDPEALRRMDWLQDHAQYFEDNSPTMKEHKRLKATGIDARVTNVVTEAGDASPSTPIGVCLPNSEWVRERHGSKSINLDNIIDAYDEIAKESPNNGELYHPSVCDRISKYLAQSHKVLVDMHEVLGHGSGQLEQGVGQPADTIGDYFNVLEESRADLFALYHIWDPNVVEAKVLPSQEAAKAEYDSYITNGMIGLLKRIKPGETRIKQTHNRNRHMIAHWCFEMGKKHIPPVIERVSECYEVTSRGLESNRKKTYFVINDHAKLHELFGELLREVQRCKSQGDGEAAAKLIESHGTFIDQDLHKEVLDRLEKFKVKSYGAFANPRISKLESGEIIATPTKDFTELMLHYSEEYSTLI